MKKISKKSIRSLPLFGRMSLTKGQENALDELWSKAVKARAGNRCEMPGCYNTNLQAHHVKGRRNKTLRHIVSNGVSLCARHHMWAEQNGVDFSQHIIAARGFEWWDDLESYARKVKVFKEYRVIKAYLEAFL